MENVRLLPFGRKISVGSFWFMKVTRSLSKRELSQLRDADGIPDDVRKHLRRDGLPYITVCSSGGGWSISFVCGTTMFAFIEYEYGLGGEGGMAALQNLFTMMYADTTILGDSDYISAKADALKALMSRQGAAGESEAEKAADDEVLDEVRGGFEAVDSVVRTLEAVGKEVGDE